MRRLLHDRKKQRLGALLFLWLCLFAFSFSAHAADAFPASGPLHDGWMSINYYKPDGSGFRSDIVNGDYFLADTGQISPSDEYKAFVNALAAFAETGDEGHLCRYPARTTLVRAHVPALASLPRPACDEFRSQTDPAQVRSVSLVFASGYFESPASYFGHTMLRLNSDKDENNRYIFDSALNYGAKVTDSTSNPLYIWNGLTGGYLASYSGANDTIGTFGYTNHQMRDVWEYELGLTEAQKDFVVEHAWELRHARFKYYFLNDNCANRIAFLIEKATGQTLTDASGKWFLPIQVTQNLVRSDGGALIAAERRHPSLKADMRRGYVDLTLAEKKEFLGFFLEKTLDGKAKAAEVMEHRPLVVALDKLDVDMAKLKGDMQSPEGQALQAQRRVVLNALFNRPPQQQAADVEPAAGPLMSPARSKRSAALQLGYLVRPGADVTRLRYRAANNDLFTTPLDGQEASRFIMGAAEVDFSRRGVEVNKATFLDILSLNTNPLPVRLTGEHSWGLRIEYAARNNICTKCRAITAEGKLGVAERFDDSLMLYTLLGPQLNHRRTAHNDYFMLALESGFLMTPSPDWKIGGGVDIDVSPLRGNPSYLAKGTVAHDVSSRFDIRLTVENNMRDSAALVQVGFYF